MKNKKSLIITIALVLIIFLVWLFIDRQGYYTELEISKHDDAVVYHEGEVEDLEQILSWQTNCEEEQNGVWIAEHKLCYTEENALILKESCQDMKGAWIEGSLLYECKINNEVFKFGEWERIDWEFYEEIKESCLDMGGNWLGGIEEACVLNDNTFYYGKWLLLGEMEENCVNEFGGDWLGGEETKCEINGIIYPGNWVQIFYMKDTCEDIGGEWMGGTENECRVNEMMYSNQSWERIEEMKTSCEGVGGEYIGGDRYGCLWNGNMYFDAQWERAVLIPSVRERCIEDGGDWNDRNRSCVGLSKEWCDNILVEFDLGAVGYNSNRLSCIIY